MTTGFTTSNKPAGTFKTETKQYFVALLLALIVLLVLAFATDLSRLIFSANTTLVTATLFTGLILTLVFVMHHRAGQLSKKGQVEKK